MFDIDPTQQGDFSTMWLAEAEGDALGDVVVDPSAPTGNEAKQLPRQLPVLPVRDTVMFPGTVMPLGVGRPSSRKLLDDWLPKSKIIAIVAQRDEDQEEPEADDLYQIGTAAMVLKLIRQPDETVSVILHGLRRIRISHLKKPDGYFVARVHPMVEQPGKGKGFEATVGQLREQSRQLIELTPNAPEQALTILVNIDDPSNLADFLAANLNIDTEKKQDMLEQTDVAKRVRESLRLVSAQLDILKLQQKIQDDVQSSIGESQRRYFLREQLKAIHRELGDHDDSGTQVVTELRQRIIKAQPPEAVLEEADRDLTRLQSIPPASPEYSLLIGYLELLAELPWRDASKEIHNLKRARRILDRDHFDLDKVKRRLIEYLAVRQLNPKGRSPILCLVGPPGVGKTSLGQSIATALGRQFARMSFGGIRDEAEIRGHRRTYIGAMPGRILQELRRAGTNNPVMMLDEIDKLGADFRGDPASALLEVLDPAQNVAFVDRYLDLPFDLSQVIFICTANYMDPVPPALRDRMEVIEIPGYTDHDKLQIAKRYLVPRQREENGLNKSQCTWRDEAIQKLIEDYTREAGVRELERKVAAVCRAVAALIAQKKAKSRTVNAQLVRQELGPEIYFRERDLTQAHVGVATGLAYTPTGGEVLFVEATRFAGSGKLQLTGQIGQVMKESGEAALSLLKHKASDLKIDATAFAEHDLHLHVPAGAVPKDGPSAGVAMFVALCSLLTQRPVKPTLAMTGEITLRGRVLPVGGIKQKALAAARVGVKHILLPHDNEADLEEIDAVVKKKLKFTFCQTVDDVLDHALARSRRRAD